MFQQLCFDPSPNLLLPPASEGWGKVIFSVCPHLRGRGGGVPCSAEGGVPHSQVSTGGGYSISVPHSQVCMGGTPSRVWIGGYPPSRSGPRSRWGYPHPRSGQGYPILRSAQGEVTPFQYPIPRSAWGVPHPRSGLGGTPLPGQVPGLDGATPIPGLDRGTPSQVWMGVPKGNPPSRSGPRSGWVYPHSRSGWGVPPIWDWIGYPPVQDWMGDSPIPSGDTVA